MDKRESIWANALKDIRMHMENKLYGAVDEIKLVILIWKPLPIPVDINQSKPNPCNHYI